MTAICNICLRSKINLRSITNRSLENFYDELCDYGNGSKSKFCTECLYKLNKCYEFKKSCRLAVDTLKNWAKQPKAEKKPKHLLYTKMPASELSLSSKNNFKVYFYQTTDSDVSGLIDISSSTHPHIVTVNILKDDNINDPGPSKLVDDDEQVIEKLLMNEQDIKVEFGLDLDNKNEALATYDVTAIKSECTEQTKKIQDDELENDDETDNNDGLNHDDVHSSSEESIKELEDLMATLKKSKKTLSSLGMESSNPKKKTKYRRKTVDVEELKSCLKDKFDKYGTVKDDKGNVIDKDIVLNNLHKVTFLLPIKKLCLVPGPFNPLAIRKLSEVYNRFADSTIFEALCLRTHEEMLAEFEKRRQSLSYTKNPHRCETCIMGFAHRSMLDYHVKTSHNPALPFECSICHIRRGTRLDLTNHRLTHKNVLKCKLCTFSTGSRSIMNRHINKHKGVTYQCDLCENVYTGKSSLAAHVNSAHEARHVCALCAAAFMTPKGLKVHHVKKHLDEEFVHSEDNTKCEECNILFVTGDVYHKHMKVTHKVRRERKLYKGKTIYSCRLCDWKGPSRRVQIEHYQSEHPDADPTILHNGYNYLCHDCGKRFQSEVEYTGHMNKHSGTRPYACTKCPKTFFSRIVLYSHMMRHLPPSKECHHCGKKFTTSTGLGVHMRIHTNDRRFKCNICGKGFLYSGALQAHVAGVHYNIRRKRKPRQQDMMDYQSP